MDLKQMRYVLAIADTGNITKAAEKVYVTRSALNYSLLNLENEIGLPLFKRIHNNMIPTTAGEVYLAHARQILNLTDECNKTLKDMVDGTKGCLNIGITPGHGQSVFSTVFPKFYHAYPKYDFHLMEGNVKVLYSYLLDGKIDFAWAGFYREQAGIQHDILDRQEVLLAVPEEKSIFRSSSSFIQEVPIDLNLFRNETFILMNSNSLIREISDLYFEEAGFKPHVIFECSKINMAHSFVKDGIALSFVPRNLCFKNHGVIYYPLKSKKYFSLAISWREGSYLTKAEQFFIQLIHQNYQDVIYSELESNRFEIE